MNLISRGFTATAVVLVEYTSQPVLYVLGLSVCVIFALRGLITEPSNVIIDDVPCMGDELVSERSHRPKSQY